MYEFFPVFATDFYGRGTAPNHEVIAWKELKQWAFTSSQEMFDK